MKFAMPTCGGCRTCELACSFHHTGEFMPAVSSLTISEKTDGPGYDVLISEAPEGKRRACDGCEGREVPLCVVYCREHDDLSEILKEFDTRTDRRERGEMSADREGRHDRG
jgi:Fe-S-cluster-containing hydrogenase component 2